MNLPAETAPPPASSRPDDFDGAAPAQRGERQNWLLTEFGQTRKLDEGFQNWTPGEIELANERSTSRAGGPNVESIHSAALSVARSAVLETIRQEADAALSQARNQAAEIFGQAQRAAEDELRRARLEGLAAAEAKSEACVQMMAQIVEEMRDWQAKLLRRSERLVMTLVQDIAEKLFGDGFVLDPLALNLAFERSLHEARSLGDLRVHAHPSDISVLGELWPAHQTALRGQHIELIPNVDIRRGGCFIEGQYGSVDGRLDTQLQLIRERLAEELAVSERPGQAFSTGLAEDPNI